MENYLSKIDSDRFGFLVAKMNSFSEYENQPQLAVEDARKHGVSLVISRVSSAEIELINAMEDVGFRLKDVQSTYNFDLTKNEIPAAPASLCVYRDFVVKDTEAIAEMAQNSFRNYGHYNNNEKTSIINTGVIYEDWARRSCLSKDVADHVVVAEIEGTVAGFLSLKILKDENGAYAAGVMGAVRPEYRKYGVFRGINIASLSWAKNQNLCRVENNVLITNFPVNRTYASLEFNIIRTEATLHCWLG